MKSINYLDAAKKKLGVSSDYALSKQTGISQEAISQYRNGKRIMDDYTAAVLAGILEIAPIEVIATANSEREKDASKANFWKDLAKRSHVTLFAMSLITGGFIFSEGIDAKTTEYTLCAIAWIFCMVFLLSRPLSGYIATAHDQTRRDRRAINKDGT